MRLVSISLLVSSVLAAASCGEKEQLGSDQPMGVFQEEPCPVSLPESLVEGRDVVCGYVLVPESHDQDNGRTIKLAIAKVSSLSEAVEPDPVVPLPTGPGSSAFDSFLRVMASPIGQQIRSKRDGIIFEQRGLYYSEPNLVCEEPHDWFLDRYAQDLQGQDNIQSVTDAFSACRDSLIEEGVDLGAYRYTESARDLIMVMDALGYERFNALGVSAGTMLAQFLLKNHSDRLRSVIISSVARMDKSLHAAWPEYAAVNLKNLFDRCAADEECSKAYPNLGVELERAIKQFNENPVTVEVDNPRSPGTKTPLVINGDRIAEKVFVASYLTNSVPSVPEFIHAAAAGDLEQITGSLQELSGPGERFAWALGFSVFCSESPAISEDDIERAGLFPEFEEAVANNPWGPRAVRSICDIWGVERRGPEVIELPETDVPTLIISGEFDSITPEESASAVAEGLANAFHYTIPGAAHSAIESSPCPLSITFQFLENPNQEPDSSCISQLGGLEFRVNLSEQ